MRRKDISSDRKITAARPVYIGGDALFARRIRLCRMHRAPQRIAGCAPYPLEGRALEVR